MVFQGKVRKKGGAAYVTRTRDPIITNLAEAILEMILFHIVAV
jgi:hypothetical protein